MSATIKYLGTSPLPASPGSITYHLWSYSVEPRTTPNEFVGQRIALGFSSVLDIQDPSLFPSVPELADMVIYQDGGPTRQYVGRVVSAPGIQVISLVAPAATTSSEVLFLVGKPGQPWTTTPFALGAAGAPSIAQILPAPVSPATAPTPHGRLPADFVGILPYASEVFGVYQPLAGWLGRRSIEESSLAQTGAAAQEFVSPRAPSMESDFAQSPWSNLGEPASGDFTGVASDIESNFAGIHARLAETPPLAAAISVYQDESKAVLSPVGLVTLFRQYFFEFDNFLGVPSGHVWISPGGTVEVVESSTRRTLLERSAEASEEITRKAEETLTSQDDIADGVKEDNANDTKLGVSATAGANFAGIYHGDASASFSSEATTHKSSEVTHKHARNQSARIASEIHRNFKTTFHTVTETTDVTSRRYVVQNTSAALVNFELRRKMRKVGVQVQHIGTRMSWQVFLDSPGTVLGLGELVHVAPAPDLSFVKKPDEPPPLQPRDVEFAAPFTLRRYGTTKNDPHQDANYTRSAETPPVTGMHSDNNDDHIVGDYDYVAAPPGPGYTIDAIRLTSARTQSGDAQFLVRFDWLTGSTGRFTLRADFLNFGGGRIINFTVAITWKPPAIDPAQAAYALKLKEYEAQVAEVQRRAFGESVRERLKLVSKMRRRAPEDLRQEERHTVYGTLIRQLQLFKDPHIDSELIRQIFDVDEMLYFAAPDYWRPSPVSVAPRSEKSKGKYPVPSVPTPLAASPDDPLEGHGVVSWYSHADQDNTLDPSGIAAAEWRIDYLITEETEPAPLGSSLGWLVQIDADERRNQFLNAAWVKAVLPIRPGHESEALDWLAQAKVEGVGGLGLPYPVQPGDPAGYQGKTVDEVLHLLAAELKTANTDMTNTLATERVFETGFDPLAAGFRPAEPYQIFDQWLEVLPTDQVVAVEVSYDPKTGVQH